MADSVQHDMVCLIRANRWAALATVGQGAPFASMVAYAVVPDLSRFVLHLSRLAPHTRNLFDDPRAALVISEPDDGRDDPQTLARVTIMGGVTAVDKAAADYADLRALYTARLPESPQRFEFADFSLFCLVPEDVRYVGGFGKAGNFSAAKLSELARRESGLE
ncbi:MAG: pyridoxamine 5'-phosphate oxidase family protein [Gammaproteobacteria bacterium]